MNSKETLESSSIDGLLIELRRRSAINDIKAATVFKAKAFGQGFGNHEDEVSLALKNTSSSEIIKVLQKKQKVIYGGDDRLDVYQVTNGIRKATADSVAAIFSSSSVNDNGNAPLI